MPTTIISGVNKTHSPFNTITPVGSSQAYGYKNNVIARWGHPQYDTISGTVDIPVLAYHFSGIEKVVFILNGGEEVQVRSRETIDDVKAYYIRISAASFSGNTQTADDSEYNYLAALVYPVHGTPFALQGNPDIHEQPFTPPAGGSVSSTNCCEDVGIRKQIGKSALQFANDFGGSLPKPTKYVDYINGSDTTGNGTYANPFKTIGKAFIAGKYTSTHSGVNTLDGLTIVLKEGTHAVSYGVSTLSGKNRYRPVIIRAHEDTNGVDTVIINKNIPVVSSSGTANASRTGFNKLHVKNIQFKLDDATRLQGGDPWCGFTLMPIGVPKFLFSAKADNSIPIETGVSSEGGVGVFSVASNSTFDPLNTDFPYEGNPYVRIEGCYFENQPFTDLLNLPVSEGKNIANKQRINIRFVGDTNYTPWTELIDSHVKNAWFVGVGQFSKGNLYEKVISDIYNGIGFCSIKDRYKQHVSQVYYSGETQTGGVVLPDAWDPHADVIQVLTKVSNNIMYDYTSAVGNSDRIFTQVFFGSGTSCNCQGTTTCIGGGNCVTPNWKATQWGVLADVAIDRFNANHWDTDPRGNSSSNAFQGFLGTGSNVLIRNSNIGGRFGTWLSVPTGLNNVGGLNTGYNFLFQNVTNIMYNTGGVPTTLPPVFSPHQSNYASAGNPTTGILDCANGAQSTSEGWEGVGPIHTRYHFDYIDNDPDVSCTNAIDLATVLSNFNQQVSGGAADGDLNGDGIVNQEDLTTVLSRFCSGQSDEVSSLV